MAVSWCRVHSLIRRGFCTSRPPGRVSRPRFSEIKIQLLSESLHKQIFKPASLVASINNNDTVTQELDNPLSEKQDVRGDDLLEILDREGKDYVPCTSVKTINDKKIEKVKGHLEHHGLWDKQTKLYEDVDFQLPPIKGKNIDEHFKHLGQQQVQDYVALAERLMRDNIPTMPSLWQFSEGWTRYERDGSFTKVDYPSDGALVFDVETVVTEGSYPTMATALSDTHWYSWCSGYLVYDRFRWSNDLHVDDLIPLETTPGAGNSVGTQPRLVIGHNVGFDRSFVKEQYYIQKSGLRFVDTMSLHIAVCGLTNFQRVLYRAGQKDSKIRKVEEYRQKQKQRRVFVVEDWKEVSSLNNLADVHELHVGGSRLDKDPRDIFITGSTADVRENFQELMKYCANDVLATLEVFRSLWPEFQERFPHPVTLAGMLEMSTGYLPVNQNWRRYVHQANAVYTDMQREAKQLLVKLANEACSLLKYDSYKDDPWLWDLDWSVKEFKIKKTKPKKNKEAEEEEEDCVEEVLKQQENHYKAGNTLVGYPSWYRDVCLRLTDPEWAPGPSGLSSQTRVTPKLLRLTWDGFPLHYDDTHGWGYLVPGRTDNLVTSTEDIENGPLHRRFPYKSLLEMMDNESLEGCQSSSLAETESPAVPNEDLSADELEAVFLDKFSRVADDEKTEISIDEVLKYLDNIDAKRKREKGAKSLRKGPGRGKEGPDHVGDGPYNSVDIPGCWFYKIPHKDGKGKRVGNPLAKDYLQQVEDGTLRAQAGHAAGRVLRLNKMYSYWKNNHKRIESQMLVWLTEKDLPDVVTQSARKVWDSSYIDGFSLGAIVPRIVPAGTITRRAVEKTWLTASNAYEDRVGSELKSMVQSPPGYCFVGADVDSQELWIGAALGDSQFASSHGCTALGWMTLQGNKKDKTDLHSKVAETVGVSRDHAKIFNYGRIYGAGQSYAEKLLLQFNHRLTVDEAKKKAKLMFSTTKGQKSRKTGRWTGGSESAMFNKLEEIARSDQPRTPVLGCRISKALEPDNVNEDFMTSRINWVVQSSAVDYLHLMLVCMRWLFDTYNIEGRFCISIHDEVRYLVAEEDRYRAALALQITNLLTRSVFAYKLGMKDLPRAVAFFSAVDVDKCLRKEVDLGCETPSNLHGMERGYQIPKGEALNIHQILEKTNASLEKRASSSDILQVQERDIMNDDDSNNNVHAYSSN